DGIWNVFVGQSAGISNESFIQAADGIRDFHVTGVQTCALPILVWALWRRSVPAAPAPPPARPPAPQDRPASPPARPSRPRAPAKIGRASCRERVEVQEVKMVVEKYWMGSLRV